MTRDPRMDPQKGDVLDSGKLRRTVIEVTDKYVITESIRGQKVFTHHGWRKWARDAEVVTGEVSNED